MCGGVLFVFTWVPHALIRTALCKICIQIYRANKIYKNGFAFILDSLVYLCPLDWWYHKWLCTDDEKHVVHSISGFAQYHICTESCIQYMSHLVLQCFFSPNILAKLWPEVSFFPPLSWFSWSFCVILPIKLRPRNAPSRTCHFVQDVLAYQILFTAVMSETREKDDKEMGTDLIISPR